MTSYNLFLLPGDGIGPEVMAEVEKILAWFTKQGIATFKTDRGLVGGSAYDAHGKAISEEDMAKAQAADAVLFGAVGGPKWDKVPYDVRPEAGLLRLRKDLGLFANLRPAIWGHPLHRRERHQSFVPSPYLLPKWLCHGHHRPSHRQDRDRF